MNKIFIATTTLIISMTLVSCNSSEEKKDDDKIPEVKQEQVDSLLNNASNMINNANDSLKKDAVENK